MRWSDLVGKTIRSVDSNFGVNVVRVRFTDNTAVVIDTEAIGHGLYMPVVVPAEQYEQSNL